MKILRVLLNPRIASAVISAVSAVICAVLAGCRLCVGKMSIEDFEASIFNSYNTITNSLEVVK